MIGFYDLRVEVNEKKDTESTLAEKLEAAILTKVSTVSKIIIIILKAVKI